MRHEGAPQRGKGMAELPVAVRTVTISRCGGEHVPDFWQARRTFCTPPSCQCDTGTDDPPALTPLADSLGHCW